ncbi:hypothetical protein IJQ51_00880 [Candidatus Saccharibacteria bacterium]|nr:hypothetical protein [Candidatus Saccharibacteria bacterium]
MEIPKSLEDFIKIIQLTPRSVISEKDRQRIAAVMSFEERRVIDLMIEKSKMVFVGQDEILGPLTLDKLYKSGFKNFPVINAKEKVIGVLSTEALNDLSIKKTEKAEKYIDRRVNYLRTKDSLKFAVEEIIRTNGYYFLVLDSVDQLAGFFTVEMLLDYLIG